MEALSEHPQRWTCYSVWTSVSMLRVKTLWGKRWRNSVDTNSELELVALLKTGYFKYQPHDIEIRFVYLHMFPDTHGWIWVICSAMERRPPSSPNCDWWRKSEENGSGLLPSGSWRLLLSHDYFFMVHPHVSCCVTSCLVSLPLPCDCPDLFHLSLISLLCYCCQFVCITGWVTHVSFGFWMSCVSLVLGFPSACLCLDQLYNYNLPVGLFFKNIPL